MSGDPGEVHEASAVLDEEQHVQAPQEHGIDVEEVRRQDGLGLSFQERPPGLPGPRGCRIDAGALEDLPDRRRRELVSPGRSVLIMLLTASAPTTNAHRAGWHAAVVAPTLVLVMAARGQGACWLSRCGRGR